MFGKYKGKDNTFKNLINYQKPLKTLYQQLVLLGYTDTEEGFLNKILKILGDKQQDELAKKIDLLCKDLKATKETLDNLNSMSVENKKNIINLQNKIQEVDSKQDILIDVEEGEDIDIEDIDLMMNKIASFYVWRFGNNYARVNDYQFGFFRNNNNPLNKLICIENENSIQKTFFKVGIDGSYSYRRINDTGSYDYARMKFDIYIPRQADLFFINDMPVGKLGEWDYGFLQSADTIYNCKSY